MADIPRYHSYLDYYKPPSKAPGADVWGEINRGVQDALSGYMRYKEEKDYNDLQEATGKFYNLIDENMSREDIAKIGLETKKPFKFNKKNNAQFDIVVGRIVRRAPTQKMIEEDTLRQKGLAQEKGERKAKSNWNSLLGSLSSEIISGANLNLIDTGISTNAKTNIGSRLDFGSNSVKNVSDEYLKEHGIPEERIQEFKAGLTSKLASSFAGESDIRRVVTQETKIRNKSDSLRLKLIAEAKKRTAAETRQKKVYVNSMQEGLTKVGRDISALQDTTTEIDSDKAKKLARTSVSNLYLLFDKAKKQKDPKVMNEIAKSFNKITKMMMEGGKLKNQKFINEIQNRTWKDRIGAIIGTTSKESVKVDILDPTSYVYPETKLPNEIKATDILKIIKGLGKNRMKELRKGFPFLNMGTESNRLLSYILMFNYIVKYGEPDGV